MTIQRADMNKMAWDDVSAGDKLAPIHPGEILLRDFIQPMGLTRHKVAKLTRVPHRHIDKICTGKRGITAETAMRLGRLFGISAQTWMNLQTQHDLETAESTFGKDIDLLVTPLMA